ncbi:MAG: hypothetical protein L0241_14710 [Planctomycetia bacterium]|nr:hypothetical protein [Planctomycetia bacterium]
MSLRSRIQKVTKVMRADAPPLTVVLTEATAERPPCRHERTNSAGLPVLEIIYDPAGGPVELPPAPYKLIAGIDPADLV